MRTIIDNRLLQVSVCAGHVGASEYLVIRPRELKDRVVLSNANKRDIVMLKKIRAEIDDNLVIVAHQDRLQVLPEKSLAGRVNNQRLPRMSTSSIALCECSQA